MASVSASTLVARLKPLIVPQTGVQPSAALIFLHGSCDSGQGLQNWIRHVTRDGFTFPHIKVIYPTAPERPYTLHQGYVNTVWFDRLKIAPDAEECLDSINSGCQLISDLIDSEVEQGIPRDRILLGGFSMGGCLSLHVGYRFQQSLAGIFVLSSFLSQESAVYQALSNKRDVLPQLFMCHGERDDLVRYSWAESTFDSLQKLGVVGEFHNFPNLEHDLLKQELILLKKWIEKQLPRNHYTSYL